MKKTFLFGMIALLSVSLVFMGCPDDGEDEPEKSNNAGLTSVLTKAITAGSEAGTADAPKTATITLAAGTTVSAVGLTNIVVASNATFKLYSNANFTDGEITGESTISLPVGVTTPVYIKVTAQNGSTALHYKVSIEYPQDVKATYSLEVSETTHTATLSGLTIASATKLDGKVTIKLGGTLVATYVYTAAGNTAYPADNSLNADFVGRPMWLAPSATIKPAAGKYSDVYIAALFSGIVAADSTAKTYAVKQTNQALRFFTDGVDTTRGWVISPNPLTVPSTDDVTNALYLNKASTASPERWRAYGANGKTATETFGILIWNGGTGTTYTPKTATIEVQEYTTSGSITLTPNTKSTIIVDYSAVNFGS